jgi:hypothetical protein
MASDLQQFSTLPANHIGTKLSYKKLKAKLEGVGRRKTPLNT